MVMVRLSQVRPAALQINSRRRMRRRRRRYHRVLQQVLQFAQSAVAVTRVLSLYGVLELPQVRLTVTHLAHNLRKEGTHARHAHTGKGS